MSKDSNFHLKFGCIFALVFQRGSMFEVHGGREKESEELESALAERLAARGLDEAAIKRVTNLSLATNGTYGFDPQETCELFERPVPPPDFKSWKYRYIRGPLRPMARWIYRVLQEIVERMSENRVQAFTQAVFELMELRRENEELRRRLAEIEAAKAPANAPEPAVSPARVTPARLGRNTPRPL